MNKFRIRVPGSCGNVGPGFDVLGAALSIYNDLEVERTGGAFSFTAEGEGASGLSGANNLVARALRKFGGLRVRMINRIPLARGLGSSGAARLAARAAVLVLEGKPIDGAVLQAAQDEGHADNAAASFYGGFVASRMEGKKLVCHKWPAPDDWRAVAAVPAFKLSTEKARRILPKKVPMADAVDNLGRLAMLLASLETGADGLAAAMDDRLHQPYRRKLVPGFDRVREAALKAGAAGVCLSGAGPTILAVVARSADPERVGRAMEKAFKSAGVESVARTLAFDNRGLTVQS